MKAKGNCELYLFILPQQSLFVLISLRELVSFSGYDNVEELSAIIFMESSLMASCMTSLGSYLVRIIVKSISFLLVSLLLARSNKLSAGYVFFSSSINFYNSSETFNFSLLPSLDYPMSFSYLFFYDYSCFAFTLCYYDSRFNFYYN